MFDKFKLNTTKTIFHSQGCLCPL